MEKESSLAVKAYETIRQQIFDFDLFPGQIVHALHLVFLNTESQITHVGGVGERGIVISPR